MAETPPGATEVETLLTLAELQARLEARKLTAGELVRGRVLAADDAVVTVDVDGTRGVAPRGEFQEPPTPGTEVELYVDDPDAEPAGLSRHKATRLALWRWLETLRGGETVRVTVIADRGDDLSVDLGGIKATLPRRDLAPGRSRKPGELLGQSLDVRVMRIREKKGQVLVSERAPVVADRAEQKAQTLATLEAGQLVEGEVKRLVKFGAFIDIGGIDGLLHINDMSHRRLRTPSEVVDVGDVVTVKVLEYDPAAEKVSLGLKQTLPDPWSVAEERYPPGTPVRGQVVGLTQFGAFVMLPDGLEGLVHVSEMAWGKAVQRPGDVVRKGQSVDAWVLRVEPEQKRMGLTLRDPAENPWAALAERLPIGTRLESTVARVADFGIFVTLDAEKGLDGLVHQNDFSWGPLGKPPKALYKPGDAVEVMVLGIEADRGRATLGIKQLHADLASELIRKYAVGQRVEGRITSVQDFGAFMALEPGLEGLIPTGELSTARIAHPEDVVESGQGVTATITAIDTVERKVTLTLLGHGLAEGKVPAPAAQVADAEEAEAGEAAAEAAEAAAEAPEAAAEAPEAAAEAPETEAEAPEAPAEAPEAAEAPAEAPEAPAEPPAERGDTAPYGAAMPDLPAPPPAASPLSAASGKRPPAPGGTAPYAAAMAPEASDPPADEAAGDAEPAAEPEGEPGA